MSRYWAEITIATTAEAAEAIGEVLAGCGCQGVVYDDPELYREGLPLGDLISSDLTDRDGEEYKVVAYLPVDDGLDGKLAEIKAGLGRVGEFLPIGSGEITLRRVAEEDWAEAWKAYFKPEVIGRVVIRPSWIEYQPEPDQVVVDLDPGMAFGTGTHPSTRLTMQLLQETLTPSQSVLDLGTGSGILAIAAAKLMAKQVLAVDIDSVAVDVATENVKRNQLEKMITVRQGDLLSAAPGKKFDLIIANIIANVILEVIPDIPRALNPGGHFIAAGIIDTRAEEVEAAFKRFELTILKKYESAEWRAYLVQCLN
ncbi:MAG TPA: 50S ribosomal protein L11 methyltransferase [Bacillota bacterium]|nr:50S ribosomal protein L11 methyltransferase [Bacillota bacterium]